MPTDQNVFVFLSGDESRFGLTVDHDGANLPIGGKPWKPYDVIPMTLNYLGRYSTTPDRILVDLIMRGCHVTPVSGNIVPLPHRKRS